MKVERTVCILVLIWLLGVCLVRVTHGEVRDDFRDRVTRFHWAYDTFIRAYIGCPARTTAKPGAHDSMEQVQCDVLLGKIDQKAFHQAREAAKLLFDLQDKK